MRKLLLTLLLTIGVYNISYAETKKYNFWWAQLPAVCGDIDEVERFAKDKGFTKFSISIGREGGKPDGAPVYAITYWIGNDGNESMATVNTPTTNETCIIFRTFNVQINRELYEKNLWELY